MLFGYSDITSEKLMVEVTLIHCAGSYNKIGIPLLDTPNIFLHKHYWYAVIPASLSIPSVVFLENIMYSWMIIYKQHTGTARVHVDEYESIN